MSGEGPAPSRSRLVGALVYYLAMSLLSPIMKRLHKPVYESRLRGLVSAVGPMLRTGDRVLDVGCGNGTLGRALMDAQPGLEVEGLERVPRGGEAIAVSAYDGGRFPFDDRVFDVVMIADVLHHERDPVALLRECARVARRGVFIKDHKTDGPGWSLPHTRISLMDWAANAPYGVPCLYDYPTQAGWRARMLEAGLVLEREWTAMSLYPLPYRWVFTGQLQYAAWCGVRGGGGHGGGRPDASSEALSASALS